MSKRILLVEDEQDLSTLLVELLGGDFATDAVSDSQAAVERLKSFAPDLVILDVILTRGTGIDVLEAILELPNPPHVLITTGYAPDMDLSRFSSVVARVIRKPYQIDGLLDAIRQLLNGSAGVSGEGPAHHPHRPAILVVEYEKAVREEIVGHLVQSGFQAVGCETPSEALEIMVATRIDAILTAWILPEQTGLDLLAHVSRAFPEIPVVLMSAYATPQFERRARDAGAADVLTKPFPPSILPAVLGRCLQDRHGQATAGQPRRKARSGSGLRYSLGSILGRSPAIRGAVEALKQVARLDSAVLLLGETGTGKELFAQALHMESSRRDSRFVPVNVAAIPEALIEAELFGYASGAFTGARREGQAGKFVEADGGTLFLDEIGDLPLHLQAKLLRALEEGEVAPVGGAPRRLNLRFVTATHRDLPTMVRAGTFRSDLYYRLSVMCIRLPTLRERTEDIPLLARHFLTQLASRYGTFGQFAPETLELFTQYDWPGNVRELRNAVESAFALSGSGVILPRHLTGLPVHLESFSPAGALCEKETLAGALRQVNGNRTKAAKLLGISRSGLYQKLRIHGLV
ncbi:MAG TPA: sigma-54-dependent Fis family transcriptional regulator [Symbiobacteriaceae bacterium]|nr:sigma-54-dependent Fis family transcriptional regulator [Symbiobacteriaceae bacterium]